MKTIRAISIILILLGCSPIIALADVNETISFSNFTNEPQYIELAVEYDYGWAYFDIYVEPYSCSYADFWTDTYYAAYSACSYGEFSDDFYGCIEGYLNDGYNHINVDYSGYPYESDPPYTSCDGYIFDSPTATEVIVIEEPVYADHHHSGCFIDVLGF